MDGKKIILAAVIALAGTAMLLVAAGLAGCAKYSAECELIVMPRVMPVQSSPADGAGYLIRVYAYYISQKDFDERNWAPGSYADADAGLIRHAVTGEVRSQSLVRSQGKDDTYVHLELTSSPVLLVAVDPVNRFYAWRTFRYEIPMPRMYIPVRFQLWKWEAPYKDTDWIVTSAAYEETPQEETPRTGE